MTNRIEFQDADRWVEPKMQTLIFDRKLGGPRWSGDSLDIGLCETGFLGGHARRRAEYERAERMRVIRGKVWRLQRGNGVVEIQWQRDDCGRPWYVRLWRWIRRK